MCDNTLGALPCCPLSDRSDAAAGREQRWPACATNITLILTSVGFAPSPCRRCQIALMPPLEGNSAGLLVATDSALLTGHTNVAAQERSISLSMDHTQAYALQQVCVCAAAEVCRCECVGYRCRLQFKF